MRLVCPYVIFGKPSRVFSCLRRLLYFKHRTTLKLPTLLISQFLIILLLSIPLSASAEETSKIELTPAEQAWLKAHTDIVLCADRGRRPYVVVGNDGPVASIEVDLIERINGFTGAKKIDDQTKSLW